MAKKSKSWSKCVKSFAGKILVFSINHISYLNYSIIFFGPCLCVKKTHLLHNYVCLKVEYYSY